MFWFESVVLEFFWFAFFWLSQIHFGWQAIGSYWYGSIHFFAGLKSDFVYLIVEERRKHKVYAVPSQLVTWHRDQNFAAFCVFNSFPVIFHSIRFHRYYVLMRMDLTFMTHSASMTAASSKLDRGLKIGLISHWYTSHISCCSVFEEQLICKQMKHEYLV